MFITAAVAVVGLAVSAYSAHQQAGVANAQADASTAVGRARIREQNANANTERFIQGLNNKKKGKALDKNLAKAGSNIIRATRDMGRATTNLQLQQAEALGAYTAHSAMLGQQGGSMEIIETTMRLRDARLNQQGNEARTLALNDMAEQVGGLARQGYDSLDMSVLGGSIEHTAKYKQGPDYAGMLGGFLMGGGGQALAGVLGSMKSTQDSTSNLNVRTKWSEGTSWINPGSGPGSFNRPTSFSFQRPASSSVSWGIQ